MRYWSSNKRKAWDKELSAAMIDWKDDTLLTMITPCLHTVTLSLDGPPIIDPEELKTLGIDNAYVFSFTLRVSEFIPQTTELPLKRKTIPPFKYAEVDYEFTCPKLDEDTEEEDSTQVHILTAWPPIVCADNGEYNTNDYASDTPGSENYFYKTGHYTWRVSGSPEKSLPLKKKISVVVKLPPNRPPGSPIYMHGNVVVWSAPWSRRWWYFPWRNYLKRMTRALNLKEEDNLARGIWDEFSKRSRDIDDANLFDMWKKMGWSGPGTGEVLSDEMKARHQRWIHRIELEHQWNVPLKFGYDNSPEFINARERALQRADALRLAQGESRWWRVRWGFRLPTSIREDPENYVPQNF